MNKAKLSLLIAVVIIPLVLLFMGKPIAQNLTYHNFADQRFFWGTPNFLDVYSNLGFIIIGILGLKDAKEYPSYRTAWIVFFIGVILVGPGSAYYHLTPNNQTLVWDRLPMTIGFMGIFTAIISETFNLKKEKSILAVLIIFGLYSVIHWQIFGDLRLYFWVQLAPILAILSIGIMYKSDSIKGSYLILTIFFYVFAKVVEKYDPQIFMATGRIVSGHTLKHFLAAVAILCLFLMKRRSLKVC